MLSSYVVDRRVSSFLEDYDFVQMRKTNKVLYQDEEAWNIRVKNVPMYTEDPKQRLGTHYLIGWSLKLQIVPGSFQWYQYIVNWIEHRTSIKLMYSFIRKRRVEFFNNIDLSNLCPRRRFIWQFLMHRDRGLFKRQRCLYDERPAKRHMSRFQDRRNPQLCYG